MKRFILLLSFLGLMHASHTEAQTISDTTRQKVTSTIIEQHPNANVS